MLTTQKTYHVIYQFSHASCKNKEVALKKKNIKITKSVINSRAYFLLKTLKYWCATQSLQITRTIYCQLVERAGTHRSGSLTALWKKKTPVSQQLSEIKLNLLKHTGL